MGVGVGVIMEERLPPNDSGDIDSNDDSPIGMDFRNSINHPFKCHHHQGYSSRLEPLHFSLRECQMIWNMELT
jgi:hypothetical protein